ncbi:MAG: thiamine-phosphate synthase [Silanimonas sp.]|nr:MAG: thiamine-phosphate synthase [Silanimonas sp.]GIX39414.1 MAG: thiamine-phosphate synthase [Silanimonas sp.]
MRGLYLITPDDDDRDRLLERVATVLPARPALLQYRNKRASGERRRDEARAIKALCDVVGVPLVVNDDWRLAIEIGAAGAHLGEDDGDLSEARRSAPELLLGASCYDDLSRARAMAKAGADYLAFGAFFPTRTKATTRCATPALLREASALGRPRVAIGGIRADNAPALLAAGADLLAVVGAVFDAPDPLAEARRFTALFEATPTHAAAG